MKEDFIIILKLGIAILLGTAVAVVVGFYFYFELYKLEGPDEVHETSMKGMKMHVVRFNLDNDRHDCINGKIYPQHRPMHVLIEARNVANDSLLYKDDFSNVATKEYEKGVDYWHRFTYYIPTNIKEVEVSITCLLKESNIRVRIDVSKRCKT